MTSLEKKLKEFEKTARFKELVAEKIKTDANLGAGSYHKVAVTFGDRMKKLLRDEILPIKGKYSDESFLDHIVVSENFVNGAGWVIDVSFDDEFMHRDSLYPEEYPDGAELDEIFNEGYSARAYAWGEWHGDYTYSKKQRDALYFVQKSVEKFNSKYKGKAVAQYNSKYSGGTL